MKLARIFLLAALSIAAFAQELPKNLDIVYFNYDNTLIANAFVPGTGTSGVWIFIWLNDPDIYALDVQMRYEDSEGAPHSISQIMRRPFQQPGWVIQYFTVGKVDTKGITVIALKAGETRTTQER